MTCYRGRDIVTDHLTQNTIFAQNTIVGQKVPAIKDGKNPLDNCMICKSKFHLANQCPQE